jgi:hypothetical protein
MSKRILVADSSQMDNFLTCQKLHQYKDIERLAPVPVFTSDGTLKGEVSDAIVMGTFGHRLMEIYYKSIAQGISWTQALPIALAFDPYIEDPKFQLDKSVVEAIKQRFREYTYSYRDNDIIPLSPEHVEVGFSQPLVDDSERLYVVEGRIDVIGITDGKTQVMDHKFQLTAKPLYQKSIQFKTYALFARVNYLSINYVRLSKGVTSNTIKRDTVGFSILEHQRWKHELIKIFDAMWEAKDSGEYSQCWSSCGGKYGYPCDFVPLCEEFDERLIESKKMTMYQKRKEWKPW